ncbi:hypothetical protein BBK36DRAFT_164700 [Trichoderma citrinoviride]|uniref:Uncharacterized protein n=1 Tax=Trichoderma citrinoviride TaxID=58853 RepID=A0A2T4B9M8_9HYPO|nr:hypothetical protein BBK36DRAFT_164700 [Trichoderma citrinoviride]PTB66036.1 hypothetical protein BBK36DRAFT_164700 [Trichoderma citrinoviride]
MDDPDISWPAWKFGLKRDDLFTTLHDQYNTFTYTLQDPEAFHHDVYEISHRADTAEEFHRFMAARQRQRLSELEESLETLAVEIIANPKLIGSDQWQHALQLFRTKSFDSIVRYFASYLPDDYLDRHGPSSVPSMSSSFSEADSIHTTSTKASSAGDAPYFVDDDDDEFFPHGSITAEPCAINTRDMPLSPESEGSPSESADSPAFTSTNPPSRSMSFSSKRSERLDSHFIRRSSIRDDDETSQSDDGDTTVTSVCDSTETRSSFDPTDVADNAKEESLPVHIVDGDEEDDEFSTAQLPEDDFCILDSLDTPTSFNSNNTNYDTLESDNTPTPRQVSESTSYVDYKTAILRKASPSQQRPSYRRSPSPRSLLGRRREGSPPQDVRRSPEEALSRIQKPKSSSSSSSSSRRWLA